MADMTDAQYKVWKAYIEADRCFGETLMQYNGDYSHLACAKRASAATKRQALYSIGIDLGVPNFREKDRDAGGPDWESPMYGAPLVD